MLILASQRRRISQLKAAPLVCHLLDIEPSEEMVPLLLNGIQSLKEA